uniref:(northern house mosquito) hypothetical protein n=1 Tax=Culex pipiens TaxID=7175 RepID=A0A8D8JLJ5_CULPI
MPRESRSAGFSTPGTWCQTQPLLRCCISDTRFATNGFQRDGADASQLITTIESVHRWISMSTGNSGRIFCSKWHISSPDEHSSRGIVSSLVRRFKSVIGATLVFDVSRLTDTPPLLQVLRV